MKGVSYNVGSTGVPATASVSFTYGTNASQYNNGLLITMTDGVGSENYSYNALEQLTQLQKVINGTTFTTSYAYNIAGELTQITYPSGRIVQQSVDAIGRLCEVAPSSPTGCGSASNPYATGYGYNVASQVTGFKYGNGIYASLGFSPDRLQLNCLDYSTTNRITCTHDSTTKFGLGYSYGSAGSNNGQIAGITDSVDNGRSAAYTYDPLSRLSTALTNGSTNFPQWGLSWGYDRYGNRFSQTLTAGSGYQGSFTVSASTNQITTAGYTYDLNGNMTNDGMNTVAYDAENHAVSSSGTLGAGTYSYDGNGLRVQKVSGSTTNYVFSGSKVIAEYQNGAAATSPSAEYIYSGGALLAAIKTSGAVSVPNGSFQSYNTLSTPNSCGPYNGGPIPNWTGGGSWQPNSNCFNMPLPSGSIVAYTNGGTISQTLTATLQPNSTYTLSVYVGHRLDGFVDTYTIALQAGSTVLASLNGSNSTIPAGQFAQVTLNYSTGSTPPSGNLEIVLTSGSSQLDVTGLQLNGPGIQYYHQDHLSNRLVTDSAGNTLEQMGHFPFGDPWYNAANDKLYFTSYERDSESGNDYAMARYYVWRIGRFNSLDPLAGSTSDPQSLNRYTYVENNPISLIDPTGMDECLASDDVDCGVGGGGGGEDFCLGCDVGWMPPDSGMADPGGDISASAVQQMTPCQTFSGPGLCATINQGSNWQGDLPDSIGYMGPSQGGGDLIGSGGVGGGGAGGGGAVRRILGKIVHTVICTATAPLVDVAEKNGGAVGVGLGGSAGVGLVAGLAAQVGVQIVADPHGNVGVAFSGGGNPGFGVFGAGAIAGIQFTNSTANTIFGMRGLSHGGGGSGAFGGALGVDFAGSHSSNSVTATVGVGIGGKGGAYTVIGTAVPKALSTNCAD